jgi:hypothetical protein
MGESLSTKKTPKLITRMQLFFTEGVDPIVEVIAIGISGNSPDFG